MGTGLKFLFEEEVTMKQGTNLGSQIGRWIILAALVALLGALLLTIRPVGAQSDGAPQLTIVPPNTVEHNENDDGPVYTFVATDPEGKEIFWTLSGTDADDFEITDGVLEFKNAPDFEIPLDGTPDNTPVVGASDGTYEVTVRFSDGGNAAEHSMKVEVKDVEEDGMIMLSPLQPQVGTPLQAVIIDLDGVTTNTSFNPQATYVWSKSDSMSGTYTDIAGATQETYTPTADDEGDYLRATVTYIEHASTRPAKTEVGTATLSVRPDTHMNVAPVVPTEGQGQGRDGSTTDEEAIIRYIAEDAAVGDEVGPPVTAVDDNVDKLTYALGPVVANAEDGPSATEIAEAAPFDIDAATGQITTNRVLDFDESLSSPADGTGVAFTPREVVVTATDPDGEVLSIRVDIRVTDVDEVPLFADGLTREAIIMEQPIAMTTDDSRHIGTYDDDFATDPEGTAITRDIGGDDAAAFEFDNNNVLQFTDMFMDTTDPFAIDYENPGDADGDNLYKLTVTATDATGLMSSLAVTVKVTNDPTDDDVNAPATAFEIFNRQPEVNTVLDVTGPPTDPDDNVRSVKWQWYWQTIGDATAETPATCPAFDPAFDPESPSTTGDPDLNDSSPWMKIDGATSSNYRPTLDRVDAYDTTTPQPGDREDATDAFDCLMVRASYLDGGPRVADDSSTTNHDESRQYAYAVSDFSVQPDEGTENVAPEFQDGDTALAGIQVRPRIQENFPDLLTDPVTDPVTQLSTGMSIFSAVALATDVAQDTTPGEFIDSTNAAAGVIRILDGTFTDADSDGTIDPFEGDYNPDDFTTTGHKLTFRIHSDGPDVDSFELVDKATGAINFTASPDYEMRAQRRYTVMLTAHDPTNATDSITIIVDVENVDEPPMFVEPVAAIDFPENSTGTVVTYTADDPESDRYFWGLDGTDAALFNIGVIDGRLTFRNAPNFEDPEDGDDNGDDSVADDGVYDVVVHLLLDGESLTDGVDTPGTRLQPLAVTVTDVAEDPVFTKTTDDDDMVVPTELNIAENKQPDTMLNRAVENSPQASDEDEIPEDDMYASVALVYTISGTGTEALSIVPATGELRTTRVLDYESGDESFEVTVTATDPTKPDGLKDSIELVINVTDEDEAPVGGGTNQAPAFDSATMTREVAENTDAGMEFDDPVMATDPEDGVITHSLGGADAGHFDIESMTGQLMTKGALDHEAQSSYTVTVTAMDNDQTEPLSSMTTVTITVTNVEEDGTVTLNPSRPSVGTEITATLEDGDIVSTVTWSWASGDNADGTGFSGIGTNSATYTPVDADANMWLRAMATYTDGFASGNVEMAVSASAVTEVPVNVAPEFPNEAETRSIAENTAANTNIGDPVAATDENGDTLEYSLSGTDAVSFSIGLNTGQLQTLAPLNYETKNTYNVVVTATDPDGESDTTAVTINVTDVVEEVPAIPAIVDEYDSDNSGKIEIDELFKAIDDYFDVDIELSIDDLFAVIDAYFREG